MDLDPNPLGVLTFIVAPAILTNASSVMALGTSNRFARAIDRSRALLTEIKECPDCTGPEAELRARQLAFAERRSLLLLRALTSFYVSLGCFAGASLTSLIGAVLFVTHYESLRPWTLGLALVVGAGGVLGLVRGASLLVWETRLALQILADEAELVQREHLSRTRKQPPSDGTKPS